MHLTTFLTYMSLCKQSKIAPTWEGLLIFREIEGRCNHDKTGNFR
ncbi:hypothetical protein SAMN02745248_02444 [Hathewaya proteolytica DSM 3090]|uniref:Uncharacterized protein n=1 Tax=Hathewaya proteolytica DSM 3090 TaxID=1121331 RepID=A0A1M6S380_9CLOT|nr:hypothetical protein SAMN02745248_02444 [Hathewaya proteolytica DSM 3090]